MLASPRTTRTPPFPARSSRPRALLVGLAGLAGLAAGCITVNVHLPPLSEPAASPDAAAPTASTPPGAARAEDAADPSVASRPPTSPAECAPPERLELASIPFDPSLDVVRPDVLAVFEVEGDALVRTYFRDEAVAEGALDLWRELVLRIPANQRPDLVQFELYGKTGRSGFVDNGGTNSVVGRYGATLALSVVNLDRNPADPCAPLARRRGTFDWTLVHEFGHLYGFSTGLTNAYTRRFPGAQGPGEGYPEDGSPRLDGDWVTSYAERAGGDEDVSESFTAYVMLDELPGGGSLAAEKVRWFAEQPGLPELRRALRVTEPDGSTAPLTPVPRRTFPLEVAPAEWMLGTWAGTTEQGVRLEYRITADEIERLRTRNGEPSEHLRYAHLRDDGALATIEVYESSDDFHLHQVSIAGTNFSESFRPRDGALEVELERHGTFEVARVK